MRLRKLRTTREAFFGVVIRRAVDEVLSLGAKRFSIEQLESTEKTYAGTRVEMLVRDALDVGRGTRADALIAGHEVEIKWSKLRKLAVRDRTQAVSIAMKRGLVRTE